MSARYKISGNFKTTNKTKIRYYPKPSNFNCIHVVCVHRRGMISGPVSLNHPSLDLTVYQIPSLQVSSSAWVPRHEIRCCSFWTPSFRCSAPCSYRRRAHHLRKSGVLTSLAPTSVATWDDICEILVFSKFTGLPSPDAQEIEKL